MSRFQTGTETVRSSCGDSAKRIANSHMFSVTKLFIALAAICVLASALLLTGCKSSGTSSLANDDSTNSAKSEATSAGEMGSQQPSTSESAASTDAQPATSESAASTDTQPSASESNASAAAQPAASEGTASTDAQPAASEGAASAAISDGVYSTSFFRVELPADLEQKVTYRKGDGFCLDDTALFNVHYIADNPNSSGSYAGDAGYEEERKLDRYSLGKANDGTDSADVSITVFYVIPGDKRPGWGENVHWGDPSTETLACDGLMGMTLDELVACVKLKNGNDWLPAHIEEKTSDGAVGAWSAHPEAKFWGIWVSASKDENTAKATAEEVSATGLHGWVILTTDWSNLNSEPWYAVTAGRYSSQQDAESHLQSVKDAGYDDATIKYSGDYQG